MPTRGSDRTLPQITWLALITVYIAWGSTYVAIRVMDETVPPLIGGGIRFACAGLAMYAFISWRRRGFPRLSLREFGSVAVVGILLLVGGNGLVSVAERHVPAGLTSLVIASVPLWLLVLRWLNRERPSRATLAGVGIGFVGVALLVFRGGPGEGVSIPHLLIVVGAAMSWALGSWAAARLPMPADIGTSTAIEMLVAGVVLLVLGPLVGEHWSTVAGHASLKSLASIVYLALVGSIIAFTAYVWLLQHAPISLVGTYAYVNPVVAVILGAILLSEQITVTTVIGGAVIIASVAVVIRAEPQSDPDAVAEADAFADAPKPPPRHFEEPGELGHAALGRSEA
jgi:drug/metabolite transporter (DMT)-like permease